MTAQRKQNRGNATLNRRLTTGACARAAPPGCCRRCMRRRRPQAQSQRQARCCSPRRHLDAARWPYQSRYLHSNASIQHTILYCVSMVLLAVLHRGHLGPHQTCFCGTTQLIQSGVQLHAFICILLFHLLCFWASRSRLAYTQGRRREDERGAAPPPLAPTTSLNISSALFESSSSVLW